MNSTRLSRAGRRLRAFAKRYRPARSGGVATSGAHELSRATYIASPSPIDDQLRAIFDASAPLTIFDIGSCEGEDSIRYGRLFPHSRIVACEPLPDNVTRMRRNLASYAPDLAVTIVLVAVADRNGRARFHVSSGQPDDRATHAEWDYGNKSSSLLPPERHLEIHPWLRFDRVIEVETETLEHLAGRLGIEAIDFVHLDVQGSELMVLQGAGRLMSTITAVWMEVEAIPLYRGQPLKADVERFMAERGYIKIKDTVGRVSGDQLWVRSDAATLLER